MSAMLYGIAAAAVTALLGGVGWLIRAYIRSQVEVGTAKAGEARAEETTKRQGNDAKVLKDAQAKVDALPDDAVRNELLKFTKDRRGK